MTRRFIVDLIDSDETDRFVGKYGADEITNMTNGDVIKALFPSMNFKFGGFGIDYNGNSIHTASIYPNGERLTEDWLNAPYKSESDKSADTFEKLLNSGFYERGDRQCIAQLDSLQMS